MFCRVVVTSIVAIMDAMENHINNFCHLVVEDFLMRHDMPETLRQFREEWKRPDEVRLLLAYVIELL